MLDVDEQREDLIKEILNNPKNKYGEKFLRLKGNKQLKNILKSIKDEA